MDTHATLVHEARSTLSFNARQRLGSSFQGALKRRIQLLSPPFQRTPPIQSVNGCGSLFSIFFLIMLA